MAHFLFSGGATRCRGGLIFQGGIEMLTHIIILSGYTSKFSVILQFFLITAQDFLVILNHFFNLNDSEFYFKIPETLIIVTQDNLLVF